MKTTTIVYESDNLTNIAKRIFGDDLVLRAYYLYITPRVPDDPVISTFTKSLEDSEDLQNTIYSESSTGISLDAGEILIEFANGRFVSAYSSEWGSIDLLTKGSLVSNDQTTIIFHKKESE